MATGQTGCAWWGANPGLLVLVGGKALNEDGMVVCGIVSVIVIVTKFVNGGR